MAGFGEMDDTAPVFVISVAAQLAGMHPQTLRTYDRIGLVQPRRTAKRGRRYSARDIAKLRLVQRLSQDEGINLEGIRRILAMQDEIDDLRARVEDLSTLVHLARSAPRSAARFSTKAVRPQSSLRQAFQPAAWAAPIPRLTASFSMSAARREDSGSMH